MTSYLDFNTLHTPHGRTLPFATGLKLARPDSQVVIVAGDGDALAIGGNHFLHTCRRNIDLTLIVINNFSLPPFLRMPRLLKVLMGSI